MIVYKCKLCGGSLNVDEKSHIATCEYCGTKQTIPYLDNEKKINLFKRANLLRMRCEFDNAISIYESIIAEFEDEAEAYWDLLLCKYGIEYVDDARTGKKVPTCHRTCFTSILKTQEYKMALKKADSISKEIYEAEAKEIDALQSEVLKISNKEDPYDVFICYKDTENNQRTEDSVIAQEIYDELTKNGYRVFFSRITLESTLGTEYEPYIFAALNSAKVMVHVTTLNEHSESVWVKNEWSRYISMINEGQRKVIIPVFKGINAYELPSQLTKVQSLDYSKIGAKQDLIHGISKIVKPTKSASEFGGNTEMNSYCKLLLKKANRQLQSGEFEEAKANFEIIIENEAFKEDASRGLWLCAIKASSIEEVYKTIKVENIQNQEFKNFYDNCSKETKADLQDFLDQYNTNAYDLLQEERFDLARNVFVELASFEECEEKAYIGIWLSIIDKKSLNDVIENGEPNCFQDLSFETAVEHCGKDKKKELIELRDDIIANSEKRYFELFERIIKSEDITNINSLLKAKSFFSRSKYSPLCSQYELNATYLIVLSRIKEYRFHKKIDDGREAIHIGLEIIDYRDTKQKLLELAKFIGNEKCPVIKKPHLNEHSVFKLKSMLYACEQNEKYAEYFELIGTSSLEETKKIDAKIISDVEAALPITISKCKKKTEAEQLYSVLYALPEKLDRKKYVKEIEDRIKKISDKDNNLKLILIAIGIIAALCLIIIPIAFTTFY